MPRPTDGWNTSGRQTNRRGVTTALAMLRRADSHLERTSKRLLKIEEVRSLSFRRTGTSRNQPSREPGPTCPIFVRNTKQRREERSKDCQQPAPGTTVCEASGNGTTPTSTPSHHSKEEAAKFSNHHPGRAAPTRQTSGWSDPGPSQAGTRLDIRDRRPPEPQHPAGTLR